MLIGRNCNILNALFFILLAGSEQKNLNAAKVDTELKSEEHYGHILY